MKRWSASTWITLAARVVTSLDFSLSLITFQAFWIAVHGDIETAGFALFCFDLITIFSGPVVGALADKFSYKLNMGLGLLLIVGGNVLYCLSYLIFSWRLLFTGRFIAGVGAGVLYPLTMGYVARAVSVKDQTTVVGYFAYASALARIVGPLCASAFVGSIKPMDRHEGTAKQVFNAFTSPTWVATALAAINMVAVALWFKDPKKESSMSKALAERMRSVLPAKPKFFVPETLSFCIILLPVWVVQFVATYFYWGLSGNLFQVATINYHMMDSSKDLWKLSIGSAVGFVVSFVIFMSLKRRLPLVWLTMTGLIFTALGIVLFFPFIPDHFTSALFYLGYGVATVGYAIVLPSITAINNMMAKKKMPAFSSFFVALMVSFAAAARVSGSSTFTAVVTFNHSTSVCDLLNQTHYYVNHDCILHSYAPYILTSFVIVALCVPFTYFTFPKLPKPVRAPSVSVEMEQPQRHVWVANPALVAQGAMMAQAAGNAGGGNAVPVAVEEVVPAEEPGSGEEAQPAPPPAVEVAGPSAEVAGRSAEVESTNNADRERF